MQAEENYFSVKLFVAEHDTTDRRAEGENSDPRNKKALLKLKKRSLVGP